MGCEDLLIQGVTIENNMMNRNGDGIDIDCCRNVRVSDCVITAGDDALTLRSGHRHWDKPRPCENITVSNCILRSQWENAIYAENVYNLEVEGLKATPPYEISGSPVTCVNTKLDSDKEIS